MKKLLIGLAFSILPIIAVAQFISEDENNPTEYPWCDTKIIQDICYDGISYAYLIEKNVALEDYPSSKANFLLIKDSLE